MLILYILLVIPVIFKVLCNNLKSLPTSTGFSDLFATGDKLTNELINLYVASGNC